MLCSEPRKKSILLAASISSRARNTLIFSASSEERCVHLAHRRYNQPGQLFFQLQQSFGGLLVMYQESEKAEIGCKCVRCRILIAKYSISLTMTVGISQTLLSIESHDVLPAVAVVEGIIVHDVCPLHHTSEHNEL